MNIVAFTGHRPDKIGGEYNMDFKEYGPRTMAIYNEIEQVVVHRIPCQYIITGMALGVDMIAATVAMRLDIPFTAAVPFKGQESKWPKKSRDTYDRILAAAHRVVIVSEGGYSNEKMQIRNEWMVDQLNRFDDYLIAVWNGDKFGGTYNCLKYARERLENIIYLNPNECYKNSLNL